MEVEVAVFTIIGPTRSPVVARETKEEERGEEEEEGEEGGEGVMFRHTIFITHTSSN